MAELTPEQIAKGYYTDISSVEGAIDKFEAQRLAQAKLAKEKQDKLQEKRYQTVKDLNSLFKDRYSATGTVADPIMQKLGEQQKNAVVDAFTLGKISDIDALAYASKAAQDLADKSAQISATGKTIDEAVKNMVQQKPWLKAEVLKKDAQQAAFLGKRKDDGTIEMGQEFNIPDNTVNYVDYVYNQNPGGYTDRGLRDIASRKLWDELTPAQIDIKDKNGAFQKTNLLIPGLQEKTVNGITTIAPTTAPVYEDFTVEKKYDPKTKKTIEVKTPGQFNLEGASPTLVNTMKSIASVKDAMDEEIANIDRYTKQNATTEEGKKLYDIWSNLPIEKKESYAALKLYPSLGTGKSKLGEVEQTAMDKRNLQIAALNKRNETESDKKEAAQYESLTDAYNIAMYNLFDQNAQKKLANIYDQATTTSVILPGQSAPTRVKDLTPIFARGKEKEIVDPKGNIQQFVVGPDGKAYIYKYTKPGGYSFSTEPVRLSQDGKEVPPQVFDLSDLSQRREFFGTATQAMGLSPSRVQSIIGL
jgi:hypothetical protein